MKHWLGSHLVIGSLLTAVGASPGMLPALRSGPAAVTTITMLTTDPTALPAGIDAAPARPTPSAVAPTEVPSLPPPPPVLTPTAHLTATQEPAPSEESTPIAESTSVMVPPQVGVEGVVRPIMVNLREGPGATYPILGSYARDARVQVLGKDQTGAWIRVVTPDERAGWMASNCVRLAAPLGRLPIVDGIPDDGKAPNNPPAESPLGTPVLAGGVPAESGVETKAAAVPNISDAPKGLGVVIVPETSLHIAPGSRTEVVQTLREEEQVKLFGQAKGAWVRVQPFTAVVPGWIYAAHLRPLPGAIEGSPLITPTATLSPTTTVTADARIDPPMATPSPTHAPVVVETVPEPDEPALPPPARVPVEIAVEVVQAMAAPDSRGTPPTPAPHTGVRGMRVELVTVFGDVLVEAITPPDGRVTFTRDLPAATAVFVQVPALGLRTQLPPDQVAAGTTGVTVIVPPAAG